MDLSPGTYPDCLAAMLIRYFCVMETNVNVEFLSSLQFEQIVVIFAQLIPYDPESFSLPW